MAADPLPDFLLPLLCHPQTHEPLVLQDGRLAAPDSGDTFPIRDGIPGFVTRQAPWQHRLWAWVYNRVAFGYDFGVRFGWRFALGGAPIRRESYLDRVDIRPGALVLETAAGTGANIARFPAHAAYVALDISTGMLQRCRRNVPTSHRLALVNGDMHALPFRTEAFDLAFHMGGLQFLAAPGRAIAEMYRAVRPGGQVILVDETYALPRIAARSGAAGLKGPDLLATLAPAGSAGLEAEMINEGELYYLSFRKPA